MGGISGVLQRVWPPQQRGPGQSQLQLNSVKCSQIPVKFKSLNFRSGSGRAFARRTSNRVQLNSNSVCSRLIRAWRTRRCAPFHQQTRPIVPLEPLNTASRGACTGPKGIIECGVCISAPATTPACLALALGPTAKVYVRGTALVTIAPLHGVIPWGCPIVPKSTTADPRERVKWTADST